MRLADPRRSYAVLIGVSNYDSLEFSDLAAVRNNLTDLKHALTDPKIGGLDADRCIEILNPRDARTIYRQIKRYSSSAEDTFLVYFAGHGCTGPRNELFLSLSETDPDELPVSALAFDLMRGLISESPASNRVLILDCCFSGIAVQDMSNLSATVVGQVEIEGTYTLTATARNVPALAPFGARYTAFTGELLALLERGVQDGSEFISYGDLYRNLLDVMKTRNLPSPGQRGTGTVDQLGLARNRAWNRRRPSRYDRSVYGRRGPRGTEGLTIREKIYHAIVAHVQAEHPYTACGLVAGPNGSGRPERFIPMWNAERSLTFYAFDPQQNLTVWREMDKLEEEPVIIYYSHTATEAYPSRTTVSMATYWEAHYVIVSTMDYDNPDFRSFRIRDGKVTEEWVDVVPD